MTAACSGSAPSPATPPHATPVPTRADFPPLLTFTGNPLAETTAEFAAWHPGATQRARAESFQVGGKGINVAKMLHRLGAPATALTFLGGPTGEECRAWLQRQPFAHFAVPSASGTRRGWVVRAPGQPETTFLGADRPPDAAAWQAAAAFMAAQSSNTVLALSGSSPGWDTPEAAPLREILSARSRHGSTLCVDSYGPPLSWSLGQTVALIKINRQEYATLCDAAGQGSNDHPLTPPADPRPRWPAVACWIITDGPRDVWLFEAGQPARSFAPPAIQEVSPTGSGDVLLATLIFERFCRRRSWPEALMRALPLAAANAAHPGIADFPLPSADL